jgi:hypothetical protein
MAGLNYGYKFTYSSECKRSSEKNDINSEGVHYTKLSKKWVVRMPNKTKSVHVKPFISIAQFDTEKEAQDKYNELTKNN